MSNEKVKITFRVTQEEKFRIERLAKKDQKSVNLYLRDRALATYPQALDGRLRTDMMRELARLHNISQHYLLRKDWDGFYIGLERWRGDILTRLENP